MARKKKKSAEDEEVQGGKKKKKGKKGLLILLLAALIIVAAAAAALKIVLPRLSGGGEEDETGAPPKKGITAYTVGEDTAPSLDTILEEADGKLIANRGPGKTKNKEGGEEEKYTYLYELDGYAAVVDRYLDVMLGEEQGFVLADETYLIQEERPPLEDGEGALLLAKASVQEGRLFQLVIGWSEANDTLAVRVSVPEGTLRRPEPEKEQEPASVNEQLNTLRSMTPSQLSLPGETMGEYDIYPTDGFVKIDGMLCRRFHIYEVGGTGKLKGIIFLSGDQQHVFRMDVDDNSIITELMQ